MSLLAEIKEIEADFLFHGFLYTPLNRKQIASLLLRGFTHNEIYGFGCDAYCEA